MADHSKARLSSPFSGNRTDSDASLDEIEANWGTTRPIWRVEALLHTEHKRQGWKSHRRQACGWIARGGVALLMVTLLAAWRIGIHQASLSPHSPKNAPWQETVPEAAPAPFAGLTNLVLVAGHAVYTSHDFLDPDRNENWFLESYQMVPGQAHSFVEHIERGVKAAASDPHALLLFSGGETRRDAGPRSEGASYWQVADAAGWYGSPEVRQRAATEESARDSYENVLFGLCRFYQLTGHYPESVTVVSYEFKRFRFTHLHREALKFPEDRFFFIGTQGLYSKAAADGEARTLAAFSSDPHGCSPTLRAKKQQRNPYAVPLPTGQQCPQMDGLFQYCGREPFGGVLPWNDRNNQSVWRRS